MLNNVDSTKKYNQQRILSLCTGSRGIERGVEKVIDCRSVAYVEIEAFQIFNLVSAMEKGMVDSAPIWTDVKTFNPKPFHKRVHGIIAGYPCQGESLAGKRKLQNDDRFIWPYIENCIKSIKPIWCFFENVAGHLSGSFPDILASLRNMGYRVEAGLFTAQEVGAPQIRKRVFILAMDNSYCTQLQSKNNTSNGMAWNIFQKCWKESPERSTKTSLDDSNSKHGRLSEPAKRNENIEASRSSEEKLGHSQSFISKWNKQESNSPQIEVRGNGEILSNSDSFGRTKSISKTESKFTYEDGIKWPAQPGERQFEWEEPRTVKSSLGCTVNGYDFTTDLLRMYGNGVVEQTAELAFRKLINKMGISCSN